MRDLARLPETRSKRGNIMRLRHVRKQPGQTCGRFGAGNYAPSAEPEIVDSPEQWTVAHDGAVLPRFTLFAAVNTQFGK
jgi:hypothetical protein